MLNGASTGLLYGHQTMIDNFSLALGHLLLATALFRLVMSSKLDIDPHIQSFVDKLRKERETESVAGRNAQRRKARNADRSADDDPIPASED